MKELQKMPSAFDLNPTIYIHTLGGFSIEAGGEGNQRQQQSVKKAMGSFRISGNLPEKGYQSGRTDPGNMAG